MQQNNQPAEAKQEDLIDLPQEAPESQWKKFLLTPKFLLLVAVSIFFIGRNIYVELTKDPIKQPQPQQKSTTEEQMTPQLYNRFIWYIVLTIVFFVFYMILRRSNDAADEEKIRSEVRKQQEQALKSKKIQQKANKIITSMDQFGNVVDESAFKKNQQSKVEPEQAKKDK